MTDKQIISTGDYIKCIKVIGNWQAEIDKLRSLINMQDDNLTIATALLNFPDIITEDIDKLKESD